MSQRNGGRVMVSVAVLFAVVVGSRLSADEATQDAALERTRDQVKMLDALYKNAVVSVTNRYDGPPAIKMAKDVFEAMEKGKFHSAKLVDASGALKMRPTCRDPVREARGEANPERQALL